MIKVEMIITDADGHRVVVTNSYEDVLTGKTLDQIEQFVCTVKSDLAAASEAEILKLNQAAFTKKK